MENLPFRSVYQLDYLGGSYGRFMDSMPPGRLAQSELTRPRSYEAGVRLLQERHYRWLREVMAPRYQQRNLRRILAQPKEVKPLLFDQQEYARMEDFNLMCDRHRDTYKDYDKSHIKYAYFSEPSKYYNLTREYIKDMSLDLIR